MKDLLLYIARSLVEHPDDVTVTEKQGADELTLELRVAPDDMGKVIAGDETVRRDWHLQSLRLPRRFRYTGGIEQNKGA